MQRLQGPDLASELRSLSPTELRSVAADLGDSIGRLHAFGLRNRDLKLDNLVRDPNSGRIHVVDLDGIRRRLPLERRGQGRDLGRLLAAYRAATDSDPVEPGLLRAFYRSYRAAWRRLGLKPSRNLRRHTEARAREWAAAHRNTSAR